MLAGSISYTPVNDEAQTAALEAAQEQPPVVVRILREPVPTATPVVSELRAAAASTEATTPNFSVTARPLQRPPEISETLQLQVDAPPVIQTRDTAPEQIQRPPRVVTGSDLDLEVNFNAADFQFAGLQVLAPDVTAIARAVTRDGGSIDDDSRAVSAGDFDLSEFTLGEVAQAAGMALSAGTVWWALRASGLLAGLVVSMPAWRHADLLAILPDEDEEELWDTESDMEAGRDEAALENVLDGVETEGAR